MINFRKQLLDFLQKSAILHPIVKGPMPTQSERRTLKDIVNALDGNAAVDSYIMHQLISAELEDVSPENVHLPILVRVRENSKIDFHEYATVYSQIGPIVALSVTAEQLVVLAGLDEVISFEASRPASFDY